MNAAALQGDFLFLAQVLRQRLAPYRSGEREESSPDIPASPEANQTLEALFAASTRHQAQSAANSDRQALPYSLFSEVTSPLEKAQIHLILSLALSQYLFPGLLDSFLEVEQASGNRISVWGGYKKESQKGFFPTVRTALFLLAGNDFQQRIELIKTLFQPDYALFTQGILEPIRSPLLADEPLTLTPEFLYRHILHQEYLPSPGPEFPAQRLTTSQTWSDLVVDGLTQAQLERAKAWMQHYQQLQQDPFFAKDLAGCRILFEGPPGAGKTLSAKLLAQELGLPLYRIDLSKIVSKWVGETEKNLEKVFSLAQGKNWVLFFDEGESLFGKRGGSNSGNDRFANQEISYLLQKIESHSGILILATNIKSHLDQAFLRRFVVVVSYHLPGILEAEQLWQQAFAGSKFVVDPAIRWSRVASLYHQQGLSAAFITNVKHQCGILALAKKEEVITEATFTEGFQFELQRIGVTFKPLDFPKTSKA